MKKIFLQILFGVSIFGNTVYAQSITNGLIRNYSLDGNATDSLNQKNGTIVGMVTPTKDRFNNDNSAMNFDGNSYISIPGAGLDLPEFTYSVWFKLTELPSSGTLSTLLSIGNDAGDQHLIFGKNYREESGTGFGFGSYLSTTSVANANINDTLPILAEWIHFACTRTSNEMNFFVNGELKVTTSNVSKAYYSSPLLAAIGSRYKGIQKFNGSIDEVLIYNRALSNCEISSIFENIAPIVSFDFNQNILDSKGNHNATSNEGNVSYTTDRKGNSNSAILFDKSYYLDFPATDLALDTFSYSAWILFNSLPEDETYNGYLSIGNTAGDQHLGLGTNYYNGSGTNSGSYLSPTLATSAGVKDSAYSTNQWNFITTTRTETELKFYLNGELKSTTSNITAPYYSEPVLGAIGARYNGSQKFDGKLDELNIYNVALSECNVKNLYLNTKIAVITSAPAFEEPNKIEVFPNPANNNITVKNYTGLVEIYSIDGSLKLQSNSTELNIESLESGMYILKTKDKSFKIIKN